MNGKGSADNRVKNREQYRKNYDDIFRKKTKKTKWTTTNSSRKK